MVVQLDRINCTKCDTQLDLISTKGDVFPKGALYIKNIKNIKISLKNSPIKYHNFVCTKCGRINKCIVL